MAQTYSIEFKEEACKRVQSGVPAAQVARELGVNVNTLYTWMSRFKGHPAEPYVYLNSDTILLFVGNISGIIVDFVGAIFVKMYTQNVDAAVRFHAKFAESNNLLLANSIASKIQNEELREATLSEISKQIVALKQKSNTE